MSDSKIRLDQDYSDPSADPASDSGGSETDLSLPDRKDGLRFLGGSGSWSESRPRFTWRARAFFLLLASLVSAFLLINVVGWRLQPEFADRTVRVLVAQPAPVWREVSDSFAVADAKRVLGLPITDSIHNHPHLVVPESSDQIRRFLHSSLAVDAERTAVVYLRVCASNTEQGWFLLPDGTAPQSAATGYPLQDLFDQLANSAHENILLVIDVVSKVNLRTGTFQDSFATELHSQFQNWQDQNSRSRTNVWLICAAGDGQTRSVAPRYAASPFAACVGYCLRGGSEADVTGTSDDAPDGDVTAFELAEFTRNCVANWSTRYDQRMQLPFVLTAGDDFLISPVNSSVSLEHVLRGVPDPEDDAAEEQPAELAAVDRLPADSMQQLEAAWNRIDDALRSDALKRQPATVAAIIHKLMAVEVLLVSGDTATAITTLNQDVAELFTQLNPDSTPTTGPPQLPPHVRLALRKPTDAALNGLSAVDSPAARLLRRLAVRGRVGEVWRYPATVRELVLLRQRAERVQRQAEVTDFDFHRREFAAAADILIEAEASLQSGRDAEADQRLQSFAQHLDELETRFQRTETAVRDIERLIFCMPYLLVALEQLEKTATQPAINGTALERIMTSSIALLQRAPIDPPRLLDELDGLAQLANSNLDSVLRAARASLKDNDRHRMQSFLRVPVLPASLRSQLLRALITGPQDVTFRNTAPSIPIHSSSHHAAISLQLRLLNYHDQLLSIIGPEHTNQQFVFPPDPAATNGSTPVAAGGQAPIPAGPPTGDKPTASTQSEIRDWLQQLRRDPLEVETDQISTAAVVGARLLMIVNAFWTGDSVESLDFHNQTAQTLWAARESRVAAAVARWDQRERDLLPESELQPSTVVTTGTGEIGFQVLRGSVLEVRPGETAQQQLLIRQVVGAVDREQTQLRWEWDHERYPVRFTINGVTSTTGEIVCSPRPGPDSDEFLFEVSLTDLGGSEAVQQTESSKPETNVPAGPIPVGARLELTGSQAVWLPISAAIQVERPAAARLQLVWDDAGVANGRIDLLPNQSIPISIQVEVERPLPAPLRVEFVNALNPQQLALPPEAHSTPGRHELAITDGFDLTFRTERLRLDLYSGETLIDSADLRTAILDLAQCFNVAAAMDPIQREVVARIERIHVGDVNTAVDFEMSVPGVETPGGHQFGRLAPEDEQLTLDARLNSLFAPHVHIGGSGVPRAFRRSFSPNKLDGRLDSGLSVAVASPEQGACYEFVPGVRRIPLQLQVDGQGPVTVSVGFDVDANGKLEPSERRFQAVYADGRQTAVKLVSPAESPTWTVVSEVGDITIPLDITGLEGALPILVDVATDAQRVQSGTQFYVLRKAPRLTIVKPDQDTPQSANQSLTVTLGVAPSLGPAVHGVEIGFDENLDGQLAQEEIVQPVGTAAGIPIGFGGSDRLVLRLPLPSPPPSGVQLLARSLTHLEQEESAGDQPAETAAALDPAEVEIPKLTSDLAVRPVTLATTGEIRGLIRRSDGSPVAGAGIVLSNGMTAVADAQGRYVFPAAPAGVFRVTAKSGNRSAMGVVAVKAAQVSTIDLTIYVR